MINLLGKRPFSRGDDMDKWLDENRGEKSAPAPLEAPEVESPMPTPAPIAKALDDNQLTR
jgi:AFG3 family protein